MTIERNDIATLNTKPLEEWRPSDKHIPADPDRWIEEVNAATDHLVRYIRILRPRVTK